MSAALEKRLEALERCVDTAPAVSVIFITFISTGPDKEEVRAQIGGDYFLRLDGETEEAFRQRVGDIAQGRSPDRTALVFLFSTKD
jgi:hypothetical protein